MRIIILNVIIFIITFKLAYSEYGDPEHVYRYDSDPKSVLNVGRTVTLNPREPGLIMSTAFRISNGLYVSAGHVFAKPVENKFLLEFLVPLSNSAIGFPNFSRERDIFSIVRPEKDKYLSYKTSEIDGYPIDDWALFRVQHSGHENGAASPRLPHFFRVSSPEALERNILDSRIYGFLKTPRELKHYSTFHQVKRRKESIGIWTPSPFLILNDQSMIYYKGLSGGPLYNQTDKEVLGIMSYGKNRDNSNYRFFSALAAFDSRMAEQTELFTRLDTYWNTELTKGVVYKKTIHVDSNLPYFRARKNGSFDYPATNITGALIRVRRLQRSDPGPYIVLLVANNDIETQDFVGKYPFSGKLMFPSNIVLFNPVGKVQFINRT